MRKNSTPLRLDYSNPFLDVRHTKVDFGSFEKEYFVVDFGPHAGVVAVEDRHILLTRQYRFLPDDFSWELPGGRVDPGESAEAAAVRECLEETGVHCSALRKLVEYYPGLDNCDNRTTIFASETTRAIRKFTPVESEVVEIRWIPVDEALRMVLSGQILDGLTVAGVLAYRTISAAR
jgi:8-oxo-dGTP pyrophosphatase MutT (NUDIX family)